MANKIEGERNKIALSTGHPHLATGMCRSPLRRALGIIASPTVSQCSLIDSDNRSPVASSRRSLSSERRQPHKGTTRRRPTADDDGELHGSCPA